MIDHNYREGALTRMDEFLAKTYAIRRALETQVIVKELAPGLLSFDPNQKDKAVEAITELKTDCYFLATSGLNLTLVEIQSLEQEFGPWYHQFKETCHSDDSQQEELDMNMSDIIEMALEKA